MTPAHGTLAVLGQAVENLVEMSPDVVANGNHRAVNKCYPRAFAEGIQLHEQHHFDKRSWHELHETVVGHGAGELTPQAVLDKVQVILLETAVGAEMATDEVVIISLCDSLPLRFLRLLSSLPVEGRQRLLGAIWKDKRSQGKVFLDAPCDTGYIKEMSRTLMNAAHFFYSERIKCHPNRSEFWLPHLENHDSES